MNTGSIVTALLFVAAIFFTPLVGMVPAYATAPALIIVGVYMMMSLRDLNYDDWTELIPSIVGFFMMPFAYSIATGIEFAIVLYVAIKILTGRFKDISLLMVVLALLFVAKELLAFIAGRFFLRRICLNPLAYLRTHIIITPFKLL